MQEVNRAWVFERMKHSLQLLACPPEVQLGKFPDFVRPADELAEDFDNFRGAFVGNFRAEMTAEQLNCLDSIDKSFSGMNKDSWNDDAVTNSAECQHIRYLAVKALEAFGWPLDDPPRRDHEFVPGS
jgi:hypothetical protein